MRIYISGKITGRPTEEYIEQFCKAETELIRKGYSVVNPAVTNMTLPKDTTHEEYMIVSIALLRICDTIYMLDGWLDSKGAKEEFIYAVKHDYDLMFEGDAPCRSIN